MAARAGYGQGLLEFISGNLQKEYGAGFSISALRYMRGFYRAYPGLVEIHHAVRDESGIGKVGQIHHAMRDGSRSDVEWRPGTIHPDLGWTRYRALLKVARRDARDYYEIKAIRNGWSGRHKRITLDGDHFYPDLVFYHTRLKCYVVIDLKAGKLPHAVSLLAFCDGEPAGLMNAFFGFSTFNCKSLLNIHDMIVLPEYRGLGLAQLLLAAAETLARDKGCCKLTLEVQSRNDVAMGSYRKSGFSGYELDPQHWQAQFWQKVL
jgi:ribosomal protein S18 acetylase RimI-like enzyme